MSGTDWLYLITPFIVGVVLCNMLASIPITSHPGSFKKSSKMLYVCIGIGWLLAGLAALLPIASFFESFLVLISQWILTVSLIALGGVLLVRLMRGNNWISFVIDKLVTGACLLFDATSKVLVPHLPNFIADVFSNYADTNKAKQQQEEQEEVYKTRINYHGDYSGKNDINKY